jgi:hypothetical protein
MEAGAVSELQGIAREALIEHLAHLGDLSAAITAGTGGRAQDISLMFREAQAGCR